ncbi:thioredoxin family protein [Usitatibacter rugosus]|uniref:thioredoxin family protein n=1 Tax=Usitatibacter rugosus TaxID=2732067 RepID=UPI001BB214EB|nr:thioredoxin family protein [Usitatibacter rugosus]
MAIGILSVVAGAVFLGARGGEVGGPTDLFNLQGGYRKAAVTSLSFDGATAWLNTPTPSGPDLRGKVVLVDFWTYSCINWRRTLPYVRAWNEKYKEQGLVVVGVHTPEFTFEKDIRNVSTAVKDMRIDYPVAMDSDYRVWNAFGNRYWPALYLVDAKGKVRYFHAGEGDYEGAERAIQQALEEAAAPAVAKGLVALRGTGVEAPANFAQLRTPETYIGYARAQNPANGLAVPNRQHLYRAPLELPLNAWALSGEWTISREFATGNAPGGTLAFEFHARDLHLVMGPSDDQVRPIRFRVRLAGRKPGADHGVDVDESGEGTVTEPRMYHLIRQSGSVADRRVEIEFLDAGVQAYVFTFG